MNEPLSSTTRNEDIVVPGYSSMRKAESVYAINTIPYIARRQKGRLENGRHPFDAGSQITSNKSNAVDATRI